MTPTIISKERLPLNNKPTVEKMEQLERLLAPEFLKQQQPDSELEKVLETMTLNFQFARRQSRLLQVCVRCCTKDETRLLKLFQTSCDQNRRESVQTRTPSAKRVNKSAIWRPR